MIMIQTETAHDIPDYDGMAIILNKELGRRVKEYLQCIKRIVVVNIETTHKPKYI